MTTRKELTPHSQLIAGIVSGTTAVLLLHPLDLIRVRFQAQNNKSDVTVRGKYTGLVDAFRSVIRREGVGALYQGVSANALGSGTAWGLYFLGYETIKRTIRDTPNERLAPQHHMAAALAAGACTLAVTNPIWVIKTRMCLQVHTPNGTVGNYTGLGHALRTILRTEGVAGLYSGFVPGLFGTLHGAVQFVAYEELKWLVNNFRGRKEWSQLENAEYIAAAVVSKTLATAATYPFQVIRTRLQNNVDNTQLARGMVGEARRLLRAEGPSAFYRGLFANIVRVMPATCITFVVYENASRYLQ